MNSTERGYFVRITEVFLDDPADPKYSCVAIDTPDALSLTRVSPFRRWISSDPANPPEIIPADVGDEARVSICQGEARLTNVPEQYIVGECETGP